MPDTVMTDAVTFLQDLIRIRAMPGEEGELAARVVREWRTLGFDEAFVDAAGNAVGLVRGREAGPAWLLVTHLDHVHEGDVRLWPHDPFGGELVEGRVWGRGAVDIKGPLAAQTYALAALVGSGERPARDVWITAPVEEEVGGVGIAAFVQRPPAEFGGVIVGEPSGGRLMLGHRGVAHVHVRLMGRAHHASLGLRDENPLFALAELLRRVEALELPEHPVVGRSTLTPTQVTTDSGSENLTANVVQVVLDWRPSESDEVMRATLASLLEGLPAEAELAPLWSPQNTPGFATEPTHPLARKVLPYTGEDGPGVWRFATDGRYTHAAGWPTVGWGPGDEGLAHTTRESIGVEEITDYVARLAKLLRSESP